MKEARSVEDCRAYPLWNGQREGPFRPFAVPRKALSGSKLWISLYREGLFSVNLDDAIHKMHTRSDYRRFGDEGNSETGSDYEETTKSEKNFL
ncbi:MAG: hypothetical protein ACYSWQ_08355 [Planctomycetota bacterium]|jgi:hypothetical protein